MKPEVEKKNNKDKDRNNKQLRTKSVRQERGKKKSRRNTCSLRQVHYRQSEERKIS